MMTLSRKEFLLICGTALTSIIGSNLIYSNLPKEKEVEYKYITNIQINPDEFIILLNQKKGINYIFVNGFLTQNQEEFIQELINKNIIETDNCHIQTLPKKEDKIITPIAGISIETKDNLNYTIISNNQEFSNNIQKHQSEIIAKNNTLFNCSKTR